MNYIRHKNKILSALPQEMWDRWHENIEIVNLKKGTNLFKFDGKLSHVYFPINAIVALKSELRNGSSSDYATVGNEGIVGAIESVCSLIGIHHAFIQNEGLSFKLNASFVKIDFDKSSIFRQLILRYFQALMMNAAQLAICNRYHSVEQQVCRALLSTFDRSASNTFFLTQKMISETLGIRREAAGAVTIKLQHMGLIDYTRGVIQIINTTGIERLSCECYMVIKNEYK